MIVVQRTVLYTIVYNLSEVHLAADAGVGRLPVMHGDVAAGEVDLLVLPVIPERGGK